MKLQPNFSWQSYQGKDAKEEKKQLYFQLQQQHILAANAINTTIDDLSAFTTERQTSFIWIDNSLIYTKTFQFPLSIAGANPINHGIVNIATLIKASGSAQDTIPLTALAVPIPYVDVVFTANQIQLRVTSTQIIVTLGNATWQNYIASITLEYTKR